MRHQDVLQIASKQEVCIFCACRIAGRKPLPTLRRSFATSYRARFSTSVKRRSDATTSSQNTTDPAPFSRARRNGSDRLSAAQLQEQEYLKQLAHDAALKEAQLQEQRQVVQRARETQLEERKQLAQRTKEASVNKAQANAGRNQEPSRRSPNHTIMRYSKPSKSTKNHVNISNKQAVKADSEGAEASTGAPRSHRHKYAFGTHKKIDFGKGVDLPDEAPNAGRRSDQQMNLEEKQEKPSRTDMKIKENSRSSKQGQNAVNLDGSRNDKHTLGQGRKHDKNELKSEQDKKKSEADQETIPVKKISKPGFLSKPQDGHDVVVGSSGWGNRTAAMATVQYGERDKDRELAEAERTGTAATIIRKEKDISTQSDSVGRPSERQRRGFIQPYQSEESRTMRPQSIMRSVSLDRNVAQEDVESRQTHDSMQNSGSQHGQSTSVRAQRQRESHDSRDDQSNVRSQTSDENPRRTFAFGIDTSATKRANAGDGLSEPTQQGPNSARYRSRVVNAKDLTSFPNNTEQDDWQHLRRSSEQEYSPEPESIQQSSAMANTKHDYWKHLQRSSEQEDSPAPESILKSSAILPAKPQEDIDQLFDAYRKARMQNGRRAKFSWDEPTSNAQSAAAENSASEQVMPRYRPMLGQAIDNTSTKEHERLKPSWTPRSVNSVGVNNSSAISAKAAPPRDHNRMNERSTRHLDLSISSTQQDEVKEYEVGFHRTSRSIDLTSTSTQDERRSTFTPEAANQGASSFQAADRDASSFQAADREVSSFQAALERTRNSSRFAESPVKKEKLYRRGRDDDEEDGYDVVDDDVRAARESRRAEKQAKKEQAKREREMAARISSKVINLPEYISVSNLAQALSVHYDHFIRKLERLGYDDVFPGKILNAETSALIAMEYGFDPQLGSEAEREESQDLKAEPEAEDKEYLPTRPPVVTIMGHVDHGKTTIMDFMRKANVVAGEAGGITQHIGAFSVTLEATGRTITFLDTPGHAAFLAMRQRGANVTDIVVLVVAADDSVKPQTLEALKHARDANVPIIVAINKVDKPEADILRVKSDLGRHGIEIEEYGGDTQVVEVSGKTGQGMVELEEAIVLQSEVLDHRADTQGNVEGWVLEATTKPAGRVATVLVRRGTLHAGAILVAGRTWARVRSLRDDNGKEVLEAPPGTPVEVDGWRDQPLAGDEVLQAESEQKATSVIEYREEVAARRKLAEDTEAINAARMQNQTTEETEEETKETTGPVQVPFIIKSDVSGSAEAVAAYISGISSPLILPRVIYSTVGPVNEGDIELATVDNGCIISFNLPLEESMKSLAASRDVHIMEHNIIYRVLDDVRSHLEEKLPPILTQKVVGEAEVSMSFDIGIGGRKTMKIAGCKIRNGVIGRSSRVRVLRGTAKVYDGTISSLKNVKKDVTEMRKGTECGMAFEDWHDFQVGDQIQTYSETSERRRL